MGRVITLDALGTLVALEDPVPRLVAALAARGATVSAAQAAAALRRRSRSTAPPTTRPSMAPRSRRCARAVPRCCARRWRGRGPTSAPSPRRDGRRAAGRPALRAVRRRARRARRAARGRPSARRRLGLGRVAARHAAHDGPRSARRRRDQLRRGGRAQAGGGDLPPRVAVALAGAARDGGARPRCTPATRSSSTSRARGPPGWTRCSSRATASPDGVPDGVVVLDSLAGLARLAA